MSDQWFSLLLSHCFFSFPLQVNNKKPIGARARFIPELQVVCVLRDCTGGDVRLTWTELEHLRDYDNPVSPGALVKAVLLYSRLVDLSQPDSLASQLKDKWDVHCCLSVLMCFWWYFPASLILTIWNILHSGVPKRSQWIEYATAGYFICRWIQPSPTFTNSLRVMSCWLKQTLWNVRIIWCRLYLF